MFFFLFDNLIKRKFEETHIIHLKHDPNTHHRQLTCQHLLFFYLLKSSNYHYLPKSIRLKIPLLHTSIQFIQIYQIQFSYILIQVKSKFVLIQGW